MWVDKFTIRNLELFSSNGAREKCSFAEVIDRTLTPMGGRLLKRWIAMPIKDPVRINERLDVVERFIKDADLADVIREQVALVGDLERIAGRIAAQRVTPRELVQLKTRWGPSTPLKPLWNPPTTTACTRWRGRSTRWRRSANALPARSIPIRRTIRYRRAA